MNILIYSACNYITFNERGYGKEERNTRKKLISADGITREISKCFIKTSLYSLSNNAREVFMDERRITDTG